MFQSFFPKTAYAPGIVRPHIKFSNWVCSDFTQLVNLAIGNPDDFASRCKELNIDGKTKEEIISCVSDLTDYTIKFIVVYADTDSVNFSINITNDKSGASYPKDKIIETYPRLMGIAKKIAELF